MSYRCVFAYDSRRTHNAPGGIRTRTRPFRRGWLWFRLSYRRVSSVAAPFPSAHVHDSSSLTIAHMHPAGFEPATTRLRGGGSAVELRMRLPGRGFPPRSPGAGFPYAAPGGLRIHNIQPFCTALHWEGFEPSTSGFVDRNSVQLSYQCDSGIMRREGLEPPTSRLSAGCSASELTARHISPRSARPCHRER